MPAYEFRPLSKDLDRAAFACGEPSLDDYLKTKATQDVRSRIAVCYTLVERGNPTIVGYYTVSTASVALTDLPEADRKKLPRYPYVPAVLLGRLAVDVRFQGQGIGDVLLGDALLRVLRLSDEVAVNLVIVDALSERAAGFYARREFTRFPDHPLRLFLLIKKIRDIYPETASPQPDEPDRSG